MKRDPLASIRSGRPVGKSRYSCDPQDSEQQRAKYSRVLTVVSRRSRTRSKRRSYCAMKCILAHLTFSCRTPACLHSELGRRSPEPAHQDLLAGTIFQTCCRICPCQTFRGLDGSCGTWIMGLLDSRTGAWPIGFGSSKSWELIPFLIAPQAPTFSVEGPAWPCLHAAIQKHPATGLSPQGRDETKPDSRFHRDMKQCWIIPAVLSKEIFLNIQTCYSGLQFQFRLDMPQSGGCVLPSSIPIT